MARGSHDAEIARKPRAGKVAGTSPPASLLEKGLAVVATLVGEHRPMTLTQIAEASGINATSALRMLRALTDRGYVLRSPTTRRYLPGPRALFPMDLQHPLQDFRRSALPVVQGIADETGLTAGVHLFMYDARLTIEIVKGGRPLTPFYDTQAQRGPHASATGKLFLLAIGEDRAARILGSGPYPAYTDRTLVDPARVSRELADARRAGFSKAIGEAYPWLASVAAPIRTRSGGTIGALSVFSMTDFLSSEEVPGVGARLIRATEILRHACPSLDEIGRMLDA
jgi:IclR family acetate operon transcriptional repressor